MSKFKTSNILKTIAIALTISLIWQSVVWANPDVFKRDTLQAQSFFDASFESGSVGAATASYFTKYLSRLETDPDSLNLQSMKARVEEAISRMIRSEDIPARLKGIVPVLEGAPEKGEFVVDLGTCRIRFYNHRIPGTEDAGSLWKVLEDRKLGEYISRQVLISKKVQNEQEGAVAKGDAEELLKALMPEERKLPELRTSLRHKVDRLLKNVKTVLADTALEDNTRKNLEKLIDASTDINMVEFDAIVLPDAQNEGDASGWLLGFNTNVQAENRSGTSNKVNTLLRDVFPGTIGLSTQVLDLVLHDDKVLQEYVLHEVICPYFGHDKARRLQEILFPDNYKDITGDKRDGRKDGELTLAFKKVIWERSGGIPEEMPDRTEIEKEFEDFKKQDFRGDGPGLGTRFYTKYKKWRENVIRFLMINQSRYIGRGSGIAERLRALFPHEKGRIDRETARKLFREIEEQFQLIHTRLNWIWQMDTVWSETDIIIAGRPKSKLKANELEKVKSVAKRLIEAHDNFMADTVWAIDPAVRAAIKYVEQFYQRPAGQEIEVDDSLFEEGAQDGKKAVKKKDKKKDPKAKTQKIRLSIKDRIGDMLRSVNWKGLMITFAAGAVLSLFLGFILPVNKVTVIIAWVLPLAFFGYLMIKNFSWKRLVTVIGICVLFSFIPGISALPWFGLSLAIVIGTQMIFAKRGMVEERGIKGKRGAARKGAKKGKGKGASEGGLPVAEEDGEEQDEETKDTETGETLAEKEKRILQQVNISKDILIYMSRIIKLKNQPARKPEEKEGEEGKKEEDKEDKDDKEQKMPRELNARTVLDNVFRMDTANEFPALSAAKKKLRDKVREKMEELENGYSFDFHKASEVLRNWENEDDDALAEALQEVSQEVLHELQAYLEEEKGVEETLAVHELIGEYYGISNEKLWQIRLHMVRNIMRDKVYFDDMLGSASAKDYYMLGRMEFYFENNDVAEEMFEKAAKAIYREEKEEEVAKDKSVRKEYLLTLGLVKHYLKNWIDAKHGYEQSLKLRDKLGRKKEEKTDGKAEEEDEAVKRLRQLEELKTKITQLLIKKVDKKTGLEGKKGEASQMGKSAKVVSMESEMKVKVEDSKGVTHEVALTHHPEFQVSVLRQAVTQAPAIDDSHRQILLSMLSLLEKSPPALYTFDTLIEDLFGFALTKSEIRNTKYDIIAIHKSLNEGDESRIAILHEMLEYLVNKGTLRIGFNGMSLYITSDETGLFFELPLLKEDALKQAKKDPDNPHYLLRALQREVFGDVDARLTQNIKAAQDTDFLRHKRPGPMKDVDKGYAEWLGTALKDKVALLGSEIGEKSGYYADMVARALVKYDVPSLESFVARGMLRDADARALIRRETFDVRAIAELIDGILEGYISEGFTEKTREKLLWHLVTREEFNALRELFPDVTKGGAIRAFTHKPESPLKFLGEVTKDVEAIRHEPEFRDFPDWAISRICINSPSDPRNVLREALEKRTEIRKDPEFDNIPEWAVLGACVQRPRDPQGLLIKIKDNVAKIGIEEEFKDIPEWVVYSVCLHNLSKARKILRDLIKRVNGIKSSTEFRHRSYKHIFYACLYREDDPEGYLRAFRNEDNTFAENEIPQMGKRAKVTGINPGAEGIGEGQALTDDHIRLQELLREAGYPEEAVANVPRELVDLVAEMRAKYSGLAEVISGGNIEEANKITRSLLLDLHGKGYNNYIVVDPVREYLVTSLSGGNIFKELLEKERFPSKVRLRAELLECTVLAQLSYLILRDLGITDISGVFSRDHISLAVPTGGTRYLFVDPATGAVGDVELKDFFERDSVHAWKMKEGVLLEGKLMYMGGDIHTIQLVEAKGITSSMIDRQGVVFYEMGEKEKALASFRRALEMCPENAGALNNLGNMYFEEGNYAASIDMYTETLRIDPGVGAAYYNRGNAYAELEKCYEARNDYLHAQALMPEDADIAHKLSALEKVTSSALDKNMAVIHADQLSRSEKIEMIGKVIKKYKSHNEKGIFFDDGETGDRSEWIFVVRGDEPLGFIEYILEEEQSVVCAHHVFRESRGEGVGRQLIRELVEKLQYGLADNPERELLTSTRLTKQGEKIWTEMYGDAANINVSDGGKRINIDISKKLDLLPDAQDSVLDLTTAEGILKNAETAIPSLVNAMITVTEKKKRPVLAIDSSLGDGEVNALLAMLIKVIPTIDNNNSDLKRFLRDLVRINGKGEDLARRIGNITDPKTGSVDPADVIVITRKDNIDLFGTISTVVGIDDTGFSETSYLPLLEVTLFAIGKHLGWSKEDLLRYYNMIPNVIAAEDLSFQDYTALFEGEMRTLIIRLIPDAVEFRKGELRELWEGIRTMLARA
ncbi:MAG: tetratricopeptide repeat protein [Candidatus Tantalella remota]|nr:tetratricopeptide repeat protein [Candidatus Tantalella remota]